MIQIDIKTAVSALAHAVEEKGYDFVYEKFAGHGCAYVHYSETIDDQGRSIKTDLEPGCLVGSALIYLGVKPESFFNTRLSGSPINTGHDAFQACHALKYIGEIEYAPGVTEIFQQAQSVQDDGKTWGEALKAAKVKAYDMLLALGAI